MLKASVAKPSRKALRMQAADFFDQLTPTVGPPTMPSRRDVAAQYSVSTSSPGTSKRQATVRDSDTTSPARAAPPEATADGSLHLRSVQNVTVTSVTAADSAGSSVEMQVSDPCIDSVQLSGSSSAPTVPEPTRTAAGLQSTASADWLHTSSTSVLTCSAMLTGTISHHGLFMVGDVPAINSSSSDRSGRVSVLGRSVSVDVVIN